MIEERAIKVYQSMGDPYGDFVTTVFTPYDAHRLKEKLLERLEVRRVIFKDTKGKILNNVPKKGL